MKSFFLLLGIFVSPILSLCLTSKCDNAERDFFKEDKNACAVLYDDECCKGWTYKVPGNITRATYTELDNTLGADGINIFADNPKKDDAEALVVRAGCTLVARTEPFGKRGYSFPFIATNNEPLEVKELDDDFEELDETIEAVHCFCGGIKTPAVTEAQSRLNAVKGKFGKYFRRCNKFVGLFDRPSDKGGPRTCAVLFDEENCLEELEEVPEGFTELDEKDDAESVMVRPGCKFIGYDDPNKNGNKIVIDNTGKREPKVMNLNGSANLEEKIEAVECTC